MKCKLDCFLDINSELAISETDHNRIKFLIEKAFEITISEKNPTLHLYSIIIHKQIEHCKDEYYKKRYDLKYQKDIEDLVNDTHTKLDSLKEHVLERIGENERYTALNFKDEVTGKSLYQLVYISLDQFQSYLEKRDLHLLNMRNYVSIDNHRSTAKELFDKVQKVICHLRDYNIDARLIEMFIYPSERLVIMEEGLRITLHEIEYFKKFISVLHAIIEDKKEAITNRDVIYTLFFLNFNTIKFYDYVTKWIRRGVSNATSYRAKMNILYNFLNETKCGQVKSEPFLSDTECIKKLLSDFCKSEIKYFEAAESLDEELDAILKKAMIQECQEQEEKQFEGEDEKLNSHLSVEEICHIFRGMKEVGIIENRHTSQIFRVVSRFIRSFKSPNISEHSLQKKWSAGISDKARKKLIDYFQKLIKHLTELPIATE